MYDYRNWSIGSDIAAIQKTYDSMKKWNDERIEYLVDSIEGCECCGKAIIIENRDQQKIQFKKTGKILCSGCYSNRRYLQ